MDPGEAQARAIIVFTALKDKYTEVDVRAPGY